MVAFRQPFLALLVLLTVSSSAVITPGMISLASSGRQPSSPPLAELQTSQTSPQPQMSTGTNVSSAIGPSRAGQSAMGQTLRVDWEETIALPDGINQPTFSLEMIVPPGILANNYRSALGISLLTPPGQSFADNTTGRNSDFYNSIIQDQQARLGIEMQVASSIITPRTNYDELKIVMSGPVRFPAVTTAHQSQGLMVTVHFGPNLDSVGDPAANMVFQNLIMAKSMVQSLKADGFELNSNIRIQAPQPGSGLLDSSNLDGLRWAVDLGGGTGLTASTSPDANVALLLHETRHVAPSALTISPDNMVRAFEQYEVFDAGYRLTGLSASNSVLPGTDPSLSPSALSFRIDFAKGFVLDFGDATSVGIPLAYSHFQDPSGLTVDLTATADAGYDFHLAAKWGGVTHYLHAWFELHAGLVLGLDVRLKGTGVTGKFDCDAIQKLTSGGGNELGCPFSTKINTISFTVAGLPVSIDLDLGLNPTLKLTSTGQFRFHASFIASETFTIGVGWQDWAWNTIGYPDELPGCYDATISPTSCPFPQGKCPVDTLGQFTPISPSNQDGSGWCPILFNTFNVTKSGPTIVADNLVVTIELDLPVSFSGLLYGTVGPVLTVTPYAIGSITVNTTSAGPVGYWRVDMGLNFSAGVEFGGFLYDLLAKPLGLANQIEAQFAHFDICRPCWQGTFTLSPPITVETNLSQLSQHLIPIGGTIVVSGQVNQTTSHNPVPNAQVQVALLEPLYTLSKLVNQSSNQVVYTIPIPGQTFTVQTDANGAFSVTLTAPTSLETCFDVFLFRICHQARGVVNYIVTVNATSGFTASDQQTLRIVDDNTPPIVLPVYQIISVDNDTSHNSLGWTNQNITLSWDTSDPESGITARSPGCNAQTFTTDTFQKVTCSAVNGVGLNTTATAQVMIDKDPPSTLIQVEDPKQLVANPDGTTTTFVSKNTSFTLTATDTGGSGVDHTSYGIDDATTPTLYTGPFTIASYGRHRIYYRSVDVAGNIELEKSLVAIVDATKTKITGQLQGEYSDPSTLNATLTDVATQTPLSGKTITFTLGSQTVTGITDAKGVAVASIVINQAAGTSYILEASFAGDVFAPSMDDQAFVISKEPVTVQYTGYTVVTNSSLIMLRATIQEVTDSRDVSFGDLTKSSVTFAVYVQGAPSPTETVGPVSTLLTNVPGTGYNLASTGSLPVGNYTVKAFTDPNTNSYYSAPNPSIVKITVVAHSRARSTGTGAIMEGVSGLGFYSFNVRYDMQSGQLRGRFTYNYTQGSVLYSFANGSWIGLAAESTHGFFQFNARLTVTNLQTLQTYTIDGFLVRVDVYDNSQTSNPSILQVTVLDSYGLVYHQNGGQPVIGNLHVSLGTTGKG